MKPSVFSVASILFVLLLSGAAVSAQAISTDTSYGGHRYPTGELKEDFVLLRKALEEVHPALYRFASKSEMDRLFDGIDQNINYAMTEAEFWTLIAPIFGKIQCGHTRFYPSDKYKVYFHNQVKTFPFEVQLIDGRLYVVKNLSADSTVAVGTEIRSINRLSVAKMLPQFLLRTWADGYNQTMRNRIVEQTFPIWYNLILGNSDEFVIKIKAPITGKKSTIHVAGIHMNERKIIAMRRYPDAYTQEPIALKIIPGTPAVAVLTVKTFNAGALERMGFHFLEFMDSAFTVIQDQKVERLVIDLRDNNGGEPVLVRLLYAHLAKKSFPLLKRPAFKVGHPVDYLDPDTTDFYKFKPDSLGKYIWQDEGNNWYGLFPPSPIHYGGEVKVLVNGGSFSSSGFFASLVQRDHRGEFIGEESGGGTTCNDCHATLVLPHTGIRTEIPRCTVEMDFPGVKYEGKGIVPEHLVRPTVEDLVNGRDAVLEFGISGKK